MNSILIQILNELMEMKEKKNKLNDKSMILTLNKKSDERYVNKDMDKKQNKKFEPSDSKSKKEESKEYKKKYPEDSKRRQ